MNTIKKVSELLGISAAALRYYDKIGILRTKRAENGYHVYDDLDLFILQNAIVLKKAGFSLEDIKKLTNLFYWEDGDDCNEEARKVVAANLKRMYAQINYLMHVTKKLEQISPLFGTHGLYKLNQEKLETFILDLFAEAKEIERMEEDEEI